MEPSQGDSIICFSVILNDLPLSIIKYHNCHRYQPKIVENAPGRLALHDITNRVSITIDLLREKVAMGRFNRRNALY